MTNASNAAAAAASNKQEEGSKKDFRPISIVTITPTSFEPGVASNGSPYVTMRGTLVSRPGKDNLVKTVVAFGEELAAVQDKLAINESIQLRVQWNRSTLKIVGIADDQPISRSSHWRPKPSQHSKIER